MKFNRRILAGVVLAVLYAVAVAGSLVVSGLGSGVTPDTAGYLEFSPYRQPLYGLWANGIHHLTSRWSAVIILQVAMFVGSVAWILIELAAASSLGVLAAACFALIQLILFKLGLLDLVESLATEGLFYTLINVALASLLVWLRTGSAAAVAALCFLLVAMTQLRTAALLVPILALGCAAMVILAHGRNSLQGRRATLALATTALALLIAPALVGKAPLQLSSRADSLGFALLPRISLLPPDERTSSGSPEWKTMAQSWRQAAAGLDLIELSQFDAQLQEVIRFELGPKLLLPALLGISRAQAEAQWASGELFGEARRLALAAIRNEPLRYGYLCVAHLWGVLTMGSSMNINQRARVWAALNSLDPLTWKFAPLRVDYPLNHIYLPIRLPTQVLNSAIRYGSILALVLALACAVQVSWQLLRRERVDKGSLGVALCGAGAVLHSIPIALTVFPEFRYTYANFLVLSAGVLIWLAYFRHERMVPPILERA
jgi:hypothetical protein